MAKGLFEQVSVTLNGSDVSADVYGGEVLMGRRAPVDLTGLSDTFDQFAVPNLRRWSVRLNYYTNWTGTSASPIGISTVLNQVFQSSQTSGVTLIVKKTTALTSPTNPSWTGQVQLDGDFQGMAGGVAEADKGSVTLKGLGNLTFSATSS